MAATEEKLPEDRRSSPVPANGSNLTIDTFHAGEKPRSAKGVFTSGPYIINNSMTSLASGRASGNAPAYDGAVSSKYSPHVEERYHTAGPMPVSRPPREPQHDADGTSDIDNSKTTSHTSKTSCTTQTTDDRIFDPEGFGDEVNEPESLVADAPDEVLRKVVRTGPTHTNQGQWSVDSAVPPPPSHAPPAPPTAVSYPPPMVRKMTPPITVTQTRRQRAQSETSPTTSPPPAMAGLLQPPVHHTTAYRRSSPPTSKLDQTSISPPQGTQMPRLQQRHTLTVPASSIADAPRGYSSGEEGFVKNTSPIVSHRRGSINLIRRHTRSIHSDMQLDEIPQDGDAARRAELMKLKLAARRKRKEEEEDDRVLVGTRVDQNHQNWVTAYHMLTGIRFTVSRTNAKVRDHELTAADFNARHKYAFDVTGSELTPSAKYDFKFKDYAPQVFKELRSMFGIDPADYLVSLTSKILLSELVSPGKSKSFFYFSRDYRYIIKTIHHAEHKLLRKILPQYFKHVQQNPNTLLSQFYGLHRIKSTWGAHKTHFVVMNNLFPPHRDIHQTYDLKGSTVGRELKEEDLVNKPRATLKDLNWIRRNQHLAFGPHIKAQFIQQMERDVELLKKMGIMDYSLLVGIHDLNRGNQEGLRDKTLKVYQPGGNIDGDDNVASKEAASSQSIARSPSNAERTRAARELRANLRKEKPVPMHQSGIDMPDQSAADRMSRLFTKDDGGIQAEHENGMPGNEIYYLGIIDCLTKYGFVKRIEHFVKGLSANKNAISAVKPEQYGDRFVAFMKGICGTDEEMVREKQQEQQQLEQMSSAPAQTASHSTPVHNTAVAYQSNSGDPKSPIDEMTPAQEQAERMARRSGENPVVEMHQRTLKGLSMDDRESASVALPVLEEVGEAGSTGERSGASRERSRESGGEDDTIEGGSGPTSVPPPPTRAAPIAPVYGGRPPPTPPKDASPLLDALGGEFVVSSPMNLRTG